MADPVPGAPKYPLVGQNVDYFASPSTNPMPAVLADDLGGGRYNLRVVGTNGAAFAQPNVKFVTAGETAPASGEYCMAPGYGM